jgi:hypothetical protein
VSVSLSGCVCSRSCLVLLACTCAMVRTRDLCQRRPRRHSNLRC